jgi:hypothetical protein
MMHFRQIHKVLGMPFEVEEFVKANPAVTAASEATEDGKGKNGVSGKPENGTKSGC